ncbi:6-carboxytetrahydropterin synthase [Catellatospora citrea]|uniref:6-pyruvoyl trahydropterin synthase family protein n=1 Tax=Catellatospora citrea TaxID=53366 RepID=UPI0033DB4235
MRRPRHQIGKTFSFEAAHQLSDLPEGHKCGRMHGHSYQVTVSVGTDGDLTPPGFVVDFVELAPVKVFLDTTFDHRVLNEVLDVPPTSENIARWLFEWCEIHLPLPASVWVESVRVQETASSYAEYARTWA